MMKLHEKYTTSAAIFQVQIVEKIKNSEIIAGKCDIQRANFVDYLKGKKQFSEEDQAKFVFHFPYMNGRI